MRPLWMLVNILLYFLATTLRDYCRGDIGFIEAEGVSILLFIFCIVSTLIWFVVGIVEEINQ